MQPQSRWATPAAFTAGREARLPRISAFEKDSSSKDVRVERFDDEHSDSSAPLPLFFSVKNEGWGLGTRYRLHTRAARPFSSHRYFLRLLG